MQIADLLADSLTNRTAELLQMKKEGHKIIGYTPGGFMPEELVYACDALPVPVALFQGGQQKAVGASEPYLPHWMDPFCKAQIGYWALQENPLYQMIDLLVVPVTDNNNRAIADSWNFYTDTDVFRFGVPHSKTENGFNYYLEGITQLKRKLEDLTQTKISDSRLAETITVCNTERDLLDRIGATRKTEHPPISGRDFVELNHASFLLDKVTMIQLLESVYADLEYTQVSVPTESRILLTGSTMALGDYKIYDLLSRENASVVIEEFAEGMRHYWERVNLSGDLMEALADRYFRRRVPPAWFRPSRERLDFIVELAKEYNVNGVIWYQLMYRDSYDIESYYFPRILHNEADLPMLKLSSYYD
ncbi:MAG: 2-hydroxyacyl-CoA dehydratase, partial [Planctomycetes bacterium]|nr:2-hydroxyacyl-CoA dehydratase [Planctomycetota bacterium]